MQDPSSHDELAEWIRRVRVDNLRAREEMARMEAEHQRACERMTVEAQMMALKATADGFAAVARQHHRCKEYITVAM